jgi:hypothetical protein
MMGYVLCHGYCVNCGQVFSFNPNKVPSIRVHGERQPICKDCIERANPQRIANGLEPIHILPGAYDAADETEVF